MAAALLAATLVLLFHPYRGVWHDSVVYVGQVMALLHPESFRHDLFFAYGSQANYTIFPRAVAWMVERSDPGTVFLWLTLAGQAAFLFASWLLLRPLLPRAMRLPGLLALVLLPASYGAWGILSYAEPFLTGRSFAEPLALASLAALASRRYLLALALLGIAGVLHPLQTIPVVTIAWLWMAQQDRRWLHLLWSIPLAAIACWLLPELRFLTDRMDPLWYQQVWHRNLVVFYSHSGPVDWYYLLKDVFVMGVAACHAEGALRKYLLAVLGATGLLFTAGLLLADVMHFAWPAALQLWRAHWLLHWSATAILPWLFMRLWHADPTGWPRMVVFASAVVLGLFPAIAHPLMPGIALLYLAWPQLTRRLLPPLLKGLALLAGAVACTYLYPEVRSLVPWATGTDHVQWIDSMQQPRTPAALMLLVALTSLWVWNRAPGRARSLAMPLLLLALIYAGIQWDQRSQLQREFTGPTPGGTRFGVDIRPEEQVIWLGNLLPAWSTLHRPYYLHQQQLSGIIFSRQTSIEGFHRRDLLNVMNGQGEECRIIVMPKEPYASCNPDDTAVQQACKRTRGELSYFILPYQLQTKARGSWSPADGTWGTYYLYACKDFAESTATSAAIPIQ